MEQKLYCVVYRTGTWDNYKWQRTIGMPKHDAQVKREELREVEGVKTILVPFSVSLAVGLPEGYDVDDRRGRENEWMEVR